MKGMFSLSSSLYTGITISPTLPLKVFDSTIRPILAYGSEVWSVEYFKLLLKPNLIDKAPFEMINNKYCKYISGMPRRASNFAIKAELGRAPIFSFICTQALRYWHKLIKVNTNRILRSAYESELEIHNAGGTSWATFVAKLLDLIGHDSSLQSPKSDHIKQHNYSTSCKVKKEIPDLYFQFHVASIGQHSKLRTYNKFKEGIGREKYLDIEDLPQSNRKLFCAFRISCHDLEIERGRYSTPPKTPEERICKICQLQPETEEHFVIFCPHYKELRLELFKSVVRHDRDVCNIPNSDKFVYLMSHDNTEVIKAIMIFLSNAYKCRALKLRGQQPV